VETAAHPHRTVQGRRHPAWISRVRARARDNRGVAVVEAAFVTPIFFALLLGLFEIGMAMSDYLALANTVRAGARVASASSNDLTADYGIIQAIKRESSALNPNQIQLIIVYKATGFGAAPTTGCQNGVAVANLCNVYQPADLNVAKDKWGCKTTEDLDRYWCPANRKVTVTGTGSEYVGVWIKMNHPWITKMFGSTKTFIDSSVIRLEPRGVTGASN
jgi:hypothetical protein